MSRIQKFTLHYFVCFDVAFKFEDVVPATKETEEKVENLIALPEAERYFSLE